MWTPNQTARTLRDERAVVLDRWQEHARTQLRHVDRRLFASDGAVMRCMDATLTALIAYYEARRSESEGHSEESASTEVSDPVAPEPLQEYAASNAMPPIPDRRYVFNLDQAPVRQCAYQIADLSLAWADIRSLLTLLSNTVRAVLTAHPTDSTTLDGVDGYLEAITVLAADQRLQQLERELAAHREETAVTQHLGGRFLANAAHELRTPLTAVLGFAELLLEENYGPLNPEQVKTIGHIENSAQNLSEIVDNLLDLLHIRAGERPLQYRPINLRSVLEQLYQILLPLAERKSVQFELERPADLGHMEADETIVRHIVYYLLSSALRATPAAGRVTLRAWREANRVIIEVRDTALHLPPEAMANMNDPFPRLENSPARGYEGWEVGLPLVNRYVELHHGTLEYRSRPEQGTIFLVGLPVKRPTTLPAS